MMSWRIWREQIIMARRYHLTAGTVDSVWYMECHSTGDLQPTVVPSWTREKRGKSVKWMQLKQWNFHGCIDSQCKMQGDRTQGTSNVLSIQWHCSRNVRDLNIKYHYLKLKCKGRSVIDWGCICVASFRDCVCQQPFLFFSPKLFVPKSLEDAVPSVCRGSMLKQCIAGTNHKPQNFFAAKALENKDDFI